MFSLHNESYNWVLNLKNMKYYCTLNTDQLKACEMKVLGLRKEIWNDALLGLFFYLRWLIWNIVSIDKTWNKPTVRPGSIWGEVKGVLCLYLILVDTN